MAISQLSLTDFRNLESTTLNFDSTLNLIYGANGAGKTSLLEAIFVLCQAQSFRTRQLKQCIRHECNDFLLFGRFEGFKAGLAKRQQRLDIRIDGEKIKRRSELVRRTPINIVNPDSFSLVEGAPQHRRAYLDWCLFHVEPDYADTWNRFQHALKQRNRLLKSRRDYELIDYWDRHLLQPARKLFAWRQEYCARLQALIDQDLSELLHDVSIAIRYRPGWQAQQNLEDALRSTRERDLRLGFTSSGIHRDDLTLTSAGRPVSEVLSRGQSKRLCLALLLAVLKLVDNARSDGTILLIDDLHSELDQTAQALVYRYLEPLQLQLFVSNIDCVLKPSIRPKEYRMFHVEHGIIKPQNIS